ncbi:MAG: outer rane chaperone Skp (OmpH) [Bryobacterales bacterium]|nr:outer rane chaperone Skp (OmpH) [Bryobacterales bacterium]
MKSRIAILPLLAVMLGINALAQAPKIAIIDMQGALLTTKEGQAAAEQLKVKFGPAEQDLNKRQQDLKAKQDDYRKNQATMTAAQRSTLERDIDTAQKALTRDAEDARAEFGTAQNQVLGGIMEKMRAVLNKYAADNGITMIVDVSTQPNNLLYAEKSTNISEQIVKLFDSAAPAPAGAPAAPAGPAAARPAAAPRPVAPAAGRPVTPAPKTPGAK